MNNRLASCCFSIHFSIKLTHFGTLPRDARIMKLATGWYLLAVSTTWLEPAQNAWWGMYIFAPDSSVHDGFKRRCSWLSCHKRWSIRNKTWFERSHLPFEKVLKITYLWIYKAPYKLIEREVGISHKSLIDWCNFCRDVCKFTVESSECNSTGGPDNIVEIDESKFGNLLFHRGLRVDGKWVFGGIDRHTKECFFNDVDDWSADTSIPLIEQHIRPRTTIISLLEELQQPPGAWIQALDGQPFWEFQGSRNWRLHQQHWEHLACLKELTPLQRYS